LLSFEDCKLLPQSSGFQCKPVACDEQHTDVHNHRNDERAHRSDVTGAALGGRKKRGVNPLILLPDQVLMTHTRQKNTI
jgi:hypothetical protein